MTEPTVTLPPPEPGPTSTSSGRGRRTILGGIAAAVVLGGGYGAYAVYDRLDGGGPQPHDVLPASSQFYVRLDVDPSASQKIELFRLIRKFPDAAKSIGIKDTDQDVRQLVFDQLVSKECPDVDYDRDVEPWLGERIGVAGSFTDQTFEIAVQTTDEQKSRAGIKKLFSCADEDYGIAFLDGYAIVAEKQKTVDDAVAAAQKAPLGDAKRFNADVDDLGEQGVASAWLDAAALADVPELKDTLGDQLGDLDKVGSVALTLRVDGSALELAALGGSATEGSKLTDLTTLPADTVAALSFAGVGDQVSAQYETFLEQFRGAFDTPSASGLSPEAVDDATVGMSPEEKAAFEKYLEDNPVEAPDPDDFIGGFEEETGLQLPDDLETLFGDSLTLAIGRANLDRVPQLAGPEDVAALDVALSLTSDRAKALDLVERLAALADQAGISLVTKPTDDGAVLATNQGAADRIVDGSGRLGEEKAFTDVIPSGARDGGLFVNLGSIIESLQDADPPADVADVLDQLEPLSALGFSTRETDGKRTLSSVRLSFTK